MEMKIEKYIHISRNIADIFLRNFECTSENIMLLIKLLSTPLTPVVLLFDTELQDTTALELCQKYKSKYYVANTKKYSRWLIPVRTNQVKTILEGVMTSGVDTIFVFNLCGGAKTEDCLRNARDIKPELLIDNGISSFTIIIDFDEHAGELCLNLIKHNMDDVICELKRMKNSYRA